MFFTIKSNVSLTDRGYLNMENKDLQAMKWCDVINLIYFLPAINDSRKISDPHSKLPNNETKLNETKTYSSTVLCENMQSTEIRAI